jgi:hypothetical protein
MESEEHVWHPDVITRAAEGVISDLHGKTVLGRFYLAGGTGLALHLGHRRSVDLDLFSAEAVDEEALIQKAQGLPGFSLLAKSEGTLHAQIRGMKVSFLSYAYPLLFPAPLFLDVCVADPRDIGCMKISAIAGRGSKRDFIDLYTVSKLYGLRRLLEWFKRKYALANYSNLHVLKSLTYFEEAEQDPMPQMLVPLTWQQVKQHFLSEVPLLVGGCLKGNPVG